MNCAGSSSAKCGGPNALNLIVSTSGVASLSSDLTSKTVTLPSGWSIASSSCVAEGTSGRALASASTASSSMTVPVCLNYCASKGFQYAGVEYGSECYCGDSLVNGASLSLTSTGCSMSCAGDSATTCGGGNAVQLYNNPSLALVNTVVNGYALQGCIQEVNGRAFTSASTSSSTMTVETCTSFCSASGYKYAGLEYGGECYCGTGFSNGASASSLSTACNMACGGNSKENCGGPNAIQFYLSA